MTRKTNAFMLALLLGLLALPLFAGSNGWSYGNHGYGSYVPLSGSFYEAILSGNRYRSRVYFRFDNTNRNSILDYNNGSDNPGTNCDWVNAYVTVDMTANAVIDMLDAYAIYTTLPNAKTDIENDGGTPFHEETDVTALGAVSTSPTYYMSSYFHDHRNCGWGHDGNIQVQFSMSNQWWSGGDYNNCVTSSAVQVINGYGRCRGQY